MGIIPGINLNEVARKFFFVGVVLGVTPQFPAAAAQVVPQDCVEGTDSQVSQRQYGQNSGYLVIDVREHGVVVRGTDGGDAVATRGFAPRPEETGLATIVTKTPCGQNTTVDVTMFAPEGPVNTATEAKLNGNLPLAGVVLVFKDDVEPGTVCAHVPETKAGGQLYVASYARDPQGARIEGVLKLTGDAVAGDDAERLVRAITETGCLAIAADGAPEKEGAVKRSLGDSTGPILQTDPRLSPQ